MANHKTYSISIRLRRTTIEDAFVSVPVNDEIMQDTPNERGEFFIDGQKVMAVAVRLGTDAATRWKREGEPTVEPHPLQIAPNEDPGDSTKIH